MRYVLFDLGDTLESNNILRPGAREAVTAIAAMRDDRGQPPKLGLISDFHEAPTPSAIPAIVEEYRQLLKDLGLEPLFRPFEQTVTLSTQAAVRKFLGLAGSLRTDSANRARWAVGGRELVRGCETTGG